MDAVDRTKTETKAEHILQQCITLWKNANSDNEKMAALMVITRLFNAQDSDSASRKILFQAIGFDFVNRLMKSPVPADCPEHIYIALALSVLSAYATDDDLVAHPQMVQNIPLLVECVDHADDSVSSDSVHCLSALSGNSSTMQQVATCGGGIALCQYASTSKPNANMALKAVKALLVSESLTVRHLAGCAPALSTLVGSLAMQFHQKQDTAKFDVCDDLVFLLMYISSHGGNRGGEGCFKALLADTKWKGLVRDGLYDVFRSRLSEDLRAHAFSLVVAMLGLCGTQWMVAPSGKVEKSSLMVLAMKLAAVEVNIHLGESDEVSHIDTANLSSSTRATLTDCFRVTEAIITAMVDFAEMDNCSDILSGEVILLLHHSITETLRAILYYFSQLSEIEHSVLEDDLTLGAARLVAVWSEEEVDMLKAELSSCAAVLKRIASSQPRNPVFAALQDL